MKVFIFSFICVVFCQQIDAQISESLKEKVNKLKKSPANYLRQFGYLNKATFSPNMTIPTEALKQFQSYADVPETGILDEATVEKMSSPRCGLAENITRIILKTKDREDKKKENYRGRRFVQQGSDWHPLFKKTGKNDLKWTLLNKGRTLDYNIVLIVMRKAFGYWAQVTNLNFIEIAKDDVGGPSGVDQASIEILVSFVTGQHNDAYWFDGEGGTLAHAFYPANNVGLSGDVHFDDAEEYTYQTAAGKNLLWVATHEIGHSLGLEHSDVTGAVMYPWYSAYKRDFQLNVDDILGIQSIYGTKDITTTITTTPSKTAKPTTTSTTTTTPPTTSSTTTTTTTPATTSSTTTPTTTPSTTTTSTTTTSTTATGATPTPYNVNRVCPTGKISAIFHAKKYGLDIGFTTGKQIFFLGYKSLPTFRRYSYYRRRHVPENFDAVLVKSIDGRENQVIFTGRKYYIYDDFKLISGPHSINGKKSPTLTSDPFNLNFPRYIDRIDAVLFWPRNGRTYFFAGSQYWRYNNKRNIFDKGYPKDIKSNWRGLPSFVDSAFSKPNTEHSVFISGNTVYFFDDRNIRARASYSTQRFLACNGAEPIPGQFNENIKTSDRANAGIVRMSDP